MDLDHPDSGDHEHAGQRGERDASDETRCPEHHAHEHDAVDPRRHASTGTRSHVHRRAGDGTRGGHASPERRGDIGEALAEQLSVWVVTGPVGHAVGDASREKALERGECGDGHRRGDEGSDPVEGHRRNRRGGKRRGDGADAGGVHPDHLGHERGDSHGDERSGQRTVQPREHHHDGSDEDHENECPELPVGQGVDDGSRRDDRGVLPLGFRDPEGGRHLLEQDDDRDAEGEPLDDRPRNVGEIAAQAGEGSPDDEQPGEEPDHEHGVGAMARHDRYEHDGHGPGGSRHLDPRSAEDGSDQAGDDGGDEPGLGTEAGGDPERQGQRQRHDTDGHPRHQVGSPGARQPGIVRALRTQAANGRRERAHSCTAARRSASTSSVWDSESIRRRLATASSSTSWSSTIE